MFHDGVPQNGKDLRGMVAETRGPGANQPAENNRRVEVGRYPLATQAGGKYVTIGYAQSASHGAKPKPGIELLKTGKRSEILIHPGKKFLSSIGCINPCTRLPNAQEMIDFTRSRERVIAIIEDLEGFLGARFPKANGKSIPDAYVVIDGEP